MAARSPSRRLKARTHWADFRRPTLIVGRFPSADSGGLKILNMFDRASRPTFTESVVESADSAVESADYWSRLTGNWASGYGPLGRVIKANKSI